jgi:hypothetical protein
MNLLEEHRRNGKKRPKTAGQVRQRSAISGRS